LSMNVNCVDARNLQHMVLKSLLGMAFFQLAHNQCFMNKYSTKQNWCQNKLSQNFSSYLLTFWFMKKVSTETKFSPKKVIPNFFKLPFNFLIYEQMFYKHFSLKVCQNFIQVNFWLFFSWTKETGQLIHHFWKMLITIC
jgi:hypothetical protein